jgi:hypothetical protein
MDKQLPARPLIYETERKTNPSLWWIGCKRHLQKKYEVALEIML